MKMKINENYYKIIDNYDLRFINILQYLLKPVNIHISSKLQYIY